MPWIGHLWRSDQLKCHVSWSDWLSESDMTQVQYTLQFKFYIANSKAYIEFWQFITISRKFLNDYYIAGNNIADPKSFLLILWDYSMHFNQMITRSTGSKWTCFNAGNLRCPLRILNWEIGCPCHIHNAPIHRLTAPLVCYLSKSTNFTHTFPLLLYCCYMSTQSGPMSNSGSVTVASAQMIWWLSPNLITHLWLRGSAESAPAPAPAPAPAEDQESSLAPAGGTALELATNFREDFTITEKGPPRACSWLKAPASAFTFKTLC